jgi:tetratricopeptide (TPR) repeat protein
MQADPSHQYQQLLSFAVSRPGEAAGWQGLGGWLYDQKRWAASAACFSRAWSLSGDHRALCNMGWNLHLSGRTVEAKTVLLRAAGLAPNEGTPLALLAEVYRTLGDGEKALAFAREAVVLEPGVPLNRVGLSFALVGQGEWRAGWQEYEHRFAYKLPEFLTRPYRLWRGERVDHLYVECEQGLGDAIFALRWLGRAAELAERVTLYVHGPLYALVSGWCGKPVNVSAFPLPRPLPEADAWCPIMSLPAALELGGPEGEEPYIEVEGAAAGEGLNVGLCWAGNPTHEQAHHRDAALIYWLRLAEIPGVTLHSLQVGERQAELGDTGAYGLVLDRSPEITNLYDTARIVAGLDLVISVDTAVAHLAGAMGKECWLLLNQRGADFRWGCEAESTGWYPAHRLFRRALSEDWSAVMARVATALERERRCTR